jgi:3-oxoacyl-[acyl-carrier protein] reductase
VLSKQNKNMSTLKDKVILVTGSSRGIGATIAGQLAAAGAKIIVNYAGGKDAALQVVADIRQKGGDAIALQADCLMPPSPIMAVLMYW